MTDSTLKIEIAAPQTEEQKIPGDQLLQREPAVPNRNNKIETFVEQQADKKTKQTEQNSHKYINLPEKSKNLILTKYMPFSNERGILSRNNINKVT